MVTETVTRIYPVNNNNKDAYSIVLLILYWSSRWGNGSEFDLGKKRRALNLQQNLKKKSCTNKPFYPQLDTSVELFKLTRILDEILRISLQILAIFQIRSSNFCTIYAKY